MTGELPEDYYFEDDFHRELDRYFTADIACCDQCYDEFVAQWPVVARNDSDFYGNGWSLTQIFTDSRLSTIYSKDEYDRYVQRLLCPRCNKPLNETLWAYNFPFGPSNEFEEAFSEIHRLSQTMPFVVATHTFAREVMNEISRIASSISATPLGRCYYRGRPVSQLLGVVQPSDAELLPPQPSVTREGRYNHVGRPVLYLGSDVETCFAEIGKPTAGIWVAEVEVIRPVRMLDLTLLSGELPDCLTAVALSSLIGAPSETEGWDQPQYTFSRFVADCARSAGFDGIIYNSTKPQANQNLVIFGWPEPWNGIVNIRSIQRHGDTSEFALALESLRHALHEPFPSIDKMVRVCGIIADRIVCALQGVGIHTFGSGDYTIEARGRTALANLPPNGEDYLQNYLIKHGPSGEFSPNGGHLYPGCGMPVPSRPQCEEFIDDLLRTPSLLEDARSAVEGQRVGVDAARTHLVDGMNIAVDE